MISFLLVTLFRGAALPSVAFAANTNPPPQTYTLPNPLGTDSWTVLLSKFLQGITIIALPIVAIMVVIAGVMLITSGGKPETRKKAKDMILWSAIGFGVLLLADSVALIVQSLLTVTP